MHRNIQGKDLGSGTPKPMHLPGPEVTKYRCCRLDSRVTCCPSLSVSPWQPAFTSSPGVCSFQLPAVSGSIWKLACAHCSIPFEAGDGPTVCTPQHSV